MLSVHIWQYLMIYSGSQGQLLPAKSNQGFQYNSSFQQSRACCLLEKKIVSHDPIRKIIVQFLGLHSVNESENKTLLTYPILKMTHRAS